MRFIKYFLMVLIFAMFISGCGQAGPTEEGAIDDNVPGTEEDLPPAAEELEPVVYPQFISEAQPDERVVKMVTNKGDITIRLYPKYAPLAVENFLTHSENGYYDGVLFHRVIEDFMIQTGDPGSHDPSVAGRGGESIWGEPFDDEFSPGLAHFRGALSMANPGRPNMNGSQFFIVQSSPVVGDDEVARFEQFLQQRDFPESKIELYLEHGGTPHLDFQHTVFGHVVEGMDVVDAIAKVETGPNDRPVENVFIERIEIIK